MGVANERSIAWGIAKELANEGAELAFGLTVNGFIAADRVLRKGGLRPGDALILTKPVGTGTLFAADMRRQAKGRWVDAAIQAMLLSNQAAAECLYEFGVSACTDVTGFGLLGHLIEMTRSAGVDAELSIEDITILAGAAETVAAGILSSLQPQNLRLRRAVRNLESAARHLRYPLLFDPQTAGGLLAGVPAAQAEDCIQALKVRGYPETALVGHVLERSDAAEPIVLV